MKNRKFFPILFTLIFIVTIVAAIFFIPKQNKEIWNLSSFVEPLIGTGGHGHTFPGATMPFGMVQLSPDTRLTGWDGCSAYHYTDTIIYGFTHTHLSGTGCSDYGDILLMPMSGSLSYDNGYLSEEFGYSSSFKHESEIAEPGYYAVHLDNPDVDVELTTTQRVGYHKYHYNNPDSVWVVIDLAHRDDVLESGIKQVNETDIAGFRRSQAWASDQHLYFYARFSQPIKNWSYSGKNVEINEDFDLYGKNIKSAVGFNNVKDNELLVKVGISAVSIEGAKRNLEEEARGNNFSKARSIAKSAWNDELSTIIVSGDNEKNKRVFYSALYHAYIVPNIYNDVDGKYRGTDLKVHTAEEYDQYTVFSLWDTYRATHPLYTITQVERTHDFIQTFLNQYKEGGQLPVWELAGNYTGCMIGYHSVPVIADACQKGIDHFDSELALKAMIHSATMKHLGLPAYMQKGYIGVEDDHSSVSKTLEYAFDDWCIAQMAKSLDKTDIYKEYIKRAQYYKNLFDPSTGCMRARLNGSWVTPFDPSEVNFNYTEANAWQYSFYVPQDILAWADMLGGANKLDALLDSLFSADNQTHGRHQADITGLIGQYAHGNEPSHHIAYLYNYCGKPWKTQKLVKQIMTEMYNDQPDGYIGNEDCGQMSAWYVMSAMGFYPVNPANGIYDFGTPQFDTVILQLENHREFKIIADNLSDENFYIQSVRLNGKNYDKTYIKHADIMAGGELFFVMGCSPNKEFGTSKNAIYNSRITDELITISPIISPAKSVFSDSLVISINSLQSDEVGLYFTMDGSTPNVNSKKYTGEFVIKEETTIKTIAVRNGIPSFVVEAVYNKISDDAKIQLISNYSNQYNAGGDNALIDGIRGGKDFRTGQWQGYDNQDFEAIVDFDDNKMIHKIGIGFLQDIKSWIWMPTEVEFLVAGENKVFHSVGIKKCLTADDKYGSIIENIEIEIEKQKVKYIKIKAKTYGEIPDWHLGAGGEAWIFTDEIYWE